MGGPSPRIGLNLKVAQKQILTPGLVQMVSVLALNKLELREMINQEMVCQSRAGRSSRGRAFPRGSGQENRGGELRYPFCRASHA